MSSTGKSVSRTRPLPPRELGYHFGQPVIGLRTEDHIYVGRAAGDFCAFGLSHASGHAEHQATADAFPVALQLMQAAQFRKDFLGSLFADVAGVENDHIGVVRCRAGIVTQRREDIGHARGVIDIHLTAVGLDEDFLAQPTLV